MNTFLNDLYYTYGRHELPEPAQWRSHKAYDELYARLSPEGRAQLGKIIAAAQIESAIAGERAFTAGLDFAVSLFTGIFAEY
ncbi:hypothetical protein RWV98_16350 [Agathobaculum sp. NTUH-O15-33]|uniref:hypothetical protein n=1 Tax=Agathobaculum sp. NTUH-O15-33 TaxID=3079302 RepID=UPI0029587D6C|nr:hypothetical protein [Agathobaculum sp. NTUH-O15-33]WNX84125.1 hypothetical protein RWV98_16350 [Agathobaculum sp. NTUH-O15-33]